MVIHRLKPLDICYYTSENPDMNEQGTGGEGERQDPPEQNRPPWAAEFGDSFNPDVAWRLVENLRKSERRLTKERGDFEKQLKDKQDAEKSELEKLTARSNELETQLNTYKTRETLQSRKATISDIARKHGAIYPEDVYSLVSDDLDVQEDGTIANADDVVKSLRTKRPQMFNSSNSRNMDVNNGSRSNTGGGDGFNAIRRQLGIN